MTRVTRRACAALGLGLATGLATGLTAAAQPAATQAYPNRPIRLVIPSGPGGTTDIGGRIIGQRLSQILGKPVVVENRAGGGGRIGAEAVARAPNDGYTLLFANSIVLGTLVTTARDLSYDPVRDFAPVAPVSWYQVIMVCNPGLPYHSVSELIAYAKAHPGAIRYSSSGPGAGNHFAGELFNSMAGVQTTHVPYRGSAMGLNDIISGVVECSYDGTAWQQVATGQLRALAVTSLERDPRLPNVPTLDELGLRGYEIVFWQGVVAPAGTPESVLEVLGQAVNEAVQHPETKQRMYDAGFNTRGGTPQDLSKLILRDIARYRQIAQEAKLTFE
ncbi:Bug family tripartite tricarboxylate transporter substrate binding protein [Roseomonas populi]|uniref:Tripartite tricarboxylate transporter substrate binding protein n=1 Tax=Roseomonas populi TaxID=3121582 RepID=A0ABT1XAS0_9PROT|nr:tripartite tricarboxylate transporter substrate binding protein [Roseomonas pecuniae]MCR0985175.1 tripartite tricarboxylate transporter substrate binding protein [Roseomonas pecuniae]